ncbi:MAG: DNA-processing protein DprA [bacterium]
MMTDPDIVYWAVMNDFFYAETSRLVDKLRSGLSMQELFERRKGHIKRGVVDIHAYQKELERAASSGVEITRLTDEEYPETLKRTPNPPLLLYSKGKAIDFRNAIAVAGRRDLSFHGHAAAREIGRQLASKGFVVVSGLAHGADTEAHCGALEAGGETVAVLAGWLGDIYPKENRNLAVDIMRNGALLTMTSPLKRVQRHYFIRRNRITSGVSRALVIVESNGRGGTARQVDWAIEQSRPVFVLEPDKKFQEALAAYRSFMTDGAMGFSTVHELTRLVENLDEMDDTTTAERRKRITDYAE